MKFNEQEMAKLIGEVETEFKEYLTKAESKEDIEDVKKSEEVEAQAEEVTEEVIQKSEFDYDEEDIDEMNKMYASMSKAEAEAHYKSLKKLFLLKKKLKLRSLKKIQKKKTF